MTFRKLLAVFCVLISWSSVGYGQEVDDFLRCAKFTDRVERVFCLENALDEATTEEAAEAEAASGVAESEPEPAIENQQQTLQTADTATEEADAEPEAARESRFRLPVIGNIFRRNRESEGTETEKAPEPDPVASEVVTEPDPDRVGNFGRADSGARVVTGADGNEELIDVITDLEMTMPNLWQVTLASGQVWQQVHVRRYNLRKGDPVRIYPSGWGTNYRLETERLNGFIQIERVK